MGDLEDGATISVCWGGIQHCFLIHGHKLLKISYTGKNHVFTVLCKNKIDDTFPCMYDCIYCF